MFTFCEIIKIFIEKKTRFKRRKDMAKWKEHKFEVIVFFKNRKRKYTSCTVTK